MTQNVTQNVTQSTDTTLGRNYSKFILIRVQAKRLDFHTHFVPNKETTTFSLQDMFRHSYVIFSCKCDFNGCTFEFI